jgi:hypothetical protein
MCADGPGGAEMVTDNRNLTSHGGGVGIFASVSANGSARVFDVGASPLTYYWVAHLADGR